MNSIGLKKLINGGPAARGSITVALASFLSMGQIELLDIQTGRKRVTSAKLNSY